MFEIVEKVSLNASTDKMTVKAPLVAAKALPGQFVIIRADEYAERTICGPPVARIMSDCFINSADKATDGVSIQPIISLGAPAFTAASKTIFAAAIVHFFARG